ncbi:hypothetical protein GGTG_05478 [Gaeumannomyces tritici R3-111a-1]|uniref:Uncharacterized protein n=1 Tax=Gaeumannomyces tritici (strain R3-111a-1) TaxID=644352 RepID=J3NW15_GAET3|nr:hypothetical protein GGTG_05478 [Gaeumannomyces tritici R3-111a-1]EJT75545.1 hypothetical protein GGTG_05478 [Gaeumannomyces tritici R3-111a-1]
MSGTGRSAHGRAATPAGAALRATVGQGGDGGGLFPGLILTDVPASLLVGTKAAVLHGGAARRRPRVAEGYVQSDVGRPVLSLVASAARLLHHQHIEGRGGFSRVPRTACRGDENEKEGDELRGLAGAIGIRDGATHARTSQGLGVSPVSRLARTPRFCMPNNLDVFYLVKANDGVADPEFWPFTFQPTGRSIPSG